MLLACCVTQICCGVLTAYLPPNPSRISISYAGFDPQFKTTTRFGL